MTRLNLFHLFLLASSLSICSVSKAASAVQLKRLKVSAGQQTSELALAHCNLKKGTQLEGVVVVLHGRGGHESISDLAQKFALFACQRGFAVAAPAAPTKNKNWPFEKLEGEKQDHFLLALIKQILPQELRSKKKELKIYLVGISAGATFLMGDFYPRHGAQLKGFAAALCGGSQPTAARLSGLQSLEKSFPLFIQISSKDFLFQQAEQGLKKYADMGLPLRAKITDEPGHCAFDFVESLENIEKLLR